MKTAFFSFNYSDITSLIFSSLQEFTGLSRIKNTVYQNIQRTDIIILRIVQMILNTVHSESCEQKLGYTAAGAMFLLWQLINS